MPASMDRNLIYGINNAKPQPPGVTRAIQRDKLVEVGSHCVKEDIGLRDLWTGPSQYDWEASTPAVGISYDEAVQMSVDAGFTVIGTIVTTPDWALTPGPSGTADGGGNADGLGYLGDLDQDFDLPFVTEYEVRLSSGPGAPNTVEVDHASGHRIYVTASWGAGSGSVYEVRKLNHRWPPEEVYAQAFQDVCQACASHFADRISYWEFWNEENAVGWYARRDPNPPVTDPWTGYARWLARMSDGVKAGNPDALVCIGGFAWAQDDDFLNGVRSWLINNVPSGQSKYDAVAIHPYGDDYNDLPWTTSYGGKGTIDGTRANMAANGDGDKPVWFTEYGWWIGDKGALGYLDEAMQAERLENALNELLKESHSYVTAAVWLALTDLPGTVINVGLLRGDMSARPSWEKFKAMAPRVEPRVQVVES